MPAPGNNPPQRKSWREASQPGRAAAPAAGMAGARAAGWTKKTADSRYESAVLRHRLRVGFWSLLFVGLVGALLYYLFWRPVRTPLVAYVATSYAAPLPPNAWASEDLAGLRSLGAGGNLLEEKRLLDVRDVPPWESKEQWLRELRRQIESASPGGPTKKAIIIYLSLHGVVDGQGEPCLIPPGGSPWQSGQWVRVGDLLRELFAARDEKGVWSTKTRGLDKLLVLDCNRIDADWRLGQFYNTFAERLRDVVLKAGVPRLYVLNSTSPGQTAWSAAELQGSVFGHFLARGLGGAADLDTEGGNNNHQVSLRELHAYVKAHVNQWVTENRDDRQEPMLLGLADTVPDVPLVFCGAQGGNAKPAEPTTRDPGWERMAGLWEKHAALRAKTPYRTKPMEWEVYQYDLLRAEQLLQAGGAYHHEFDETVDRIDSEAAALDRPAPAPEAPPYSLALAEQWRPVAERQMRDLPAPWLPPPIARPTSADSAQAKPVAAAAKPDAKPQAAGADAGRTAESVAKKPDGPAGPSHDKTPPPAAAPPVRYAYLPATAVAWKQALEHHDSPDDIKQVLDFVDAADGQPRQDGRDGSLKADVVEVQFLRMLTAYLDSKVWDRPDLVGRALAARQAAEEAVASPDLVAQYWIRTIVDASDADRRLAEDKLYVGSPDALKQAEALWDGGKYGEAIRRATALSKALAARDRALAEGPYLAQCLFRRLAVGKPDPADLRTLLDGTQKLAMLLENAPEADTDQFPTELPQATAAVEESLKKLAAAYGDEYYDLRTAAADAHSLRRIVALLSIPLVTGGERNTLRGKALDIVAAQQASAAANAAGKAPHETSDLGGQWLSRLEQWEKTGEHLFDLGALGPGEIVQPISVTFNHNTSGYTLSGLAADRPDDLTGRLAAEGEAARNRLADLTGKVQQGCSETQGALAKRPADRPASVRQGCCRAERALRASAALFAGGPAQDLQVDPIAELRRYDLHQFMLWQARRTMDDFWGPRPELRGAAVPAELAGGVAAGHPRSGSAATRAGETPAPRQAAPYFEIVARDELRSADKLQHVAELPESARLAQLTAAAEKVLRPSVSPDKLLVDAPEAEIPQTMTVDIAPDLPRGEAAVFLAYSRGLLPATLRENHLPWRRLPLDVNTAGQVHLPEYLIAKDWQSGSDWRAEAFYRGHVRTTAFNFAPLRGVEIAYAPQPVQPAKITVFGQSKQQLGIMFIFDCSGSMGTPIVGKNPAAPKEPKINVAREAFHEVLDSLAADEGACRAGLVAYGHRVWRNDGWFTQFPKGDLLTWDPVNNRIAPVNRLNPPNPALANLDPDTDVQIMDFPGGTIAPLTVNRSREMKAQLDRLHDLGMTPLYLAIMQAIDELESDRGSTQKQIVVMTDGVNEQNDEKRRNSCEELVAKLKANPNVRLDVVAFDIADDRNKPEFRKMTDLLVPYLRTNRRGDYIEAEKFDELLAALRKSLALNKYEVCRKESDDRVGGPLELNKPCDIRPLTPGWFRAAIVDGKPPAAADVYLAGGESLRLFLKPGRDALVHERFDRDEDLAVRDFCEHVADPLDGDRTHWIGAHLPKWQGDGVEFFVSVQNGDAERFSPRPCEVWAEITPVGADAGIQARSASEGNNGGSAPKKYVYYDATFVPDKPVPVLEYLAPNWPRQAEEAQIELWCKFHPTREDEVPLGRLKQFRVADVPDVRFDWSTVRGQSQGRTKIVVDEWHPKGADIYRLKLELQTGAAAPVKEVRRLYDPAAGDMGLVRHEFILDGDPPPGDIESFAVRLVSRERLQKEAVKLPRPLRVTITR